MELIDRYLYAVGRYIPGERRDDILAELRANILALAEDREQELGRKLALDEEEAILKQHGHPAVVAARYLPQQHLIGPTVFPFYWYVLKTAFPWVVLLYALGYCVSFLFRPVTVQAIVEVVLQFVPVAFYFAAWMTLVFALFEFFGARYMKQSTVFCSWSPRKLATPQAEPEKKSSPIFDFIGSLVTLAFLIVVRQNPIWILGPAVYYKNMVRPTPVWMTVYTIAIIFVCVQLAIKFVAIFSSHLRAWRTWIDLGTKTCAIAIVSFLLTAKEYVTVPPGADASQVGKIAQALNYAMSIGWKVIIVILSVQLLWEISKRLFPRWHVYAKPHLLA
ncbi:MAG TPA: hypothetical protein VGL89_09710 [Candidatus Koribacter sp.]|jgi:hypothetical protein